MIDKPVPPELLGRLFRSDEPVVVKLTGPGPFRLPLLRKLEAAHVRPAEGRIEMRLETESGQAVRLILTDEAAADVLDILRSAFERQTPSNDREKN